jgi:GPH family glycoside/pentoside/hexuronide:cation symporter
LTFYTPDLGADGKLVYAYITYTLVMMAYTAINIPYGALMGVISPSSLERTSVSTFRFVCAFLGGIVVQYFTLDLVRFFGGGLIEIEVGGELKEVVANEAAGFFWTMCLYSTVAVVLFAITFLTTKERVEPEIVRASTFRKDSRFLATSIKLHQLFLLGAFSLVALSVGFDWAVVQWALAVYLALSIVSLVVSQLVKKAVPAPEEVSTFECDVNDLLTNRPWIVLFGFGLFQLMAAFIRGGAILYYFKYYVGDAGWAPGFWVSGSIAAIAGMLLTKPVTRILGKKNLMIAMNVGTALFTALFVMLGPTQIFWMYALHIVGSFISGPSPVILWAMYADVADYSEWKTNRRATGLVFSAATFSQKLGCAVGAAMTGLALDFYQYQPPLDGEEVAQSDLTLNGLCMMMSVLPALLLLAAAFCLLFYNINESLLQRVESDLRERKCNAGRDGA